MRSPSFAAVLFQAAVLASPPGRVSTFIQPCNDHAAHGPLVRRERLGGVLNYYYREAA